MTATTQDLRARCHEALGAHFKAPSEHSLHEGYAWARDALDSNVPLTELASMLHEGLVKRVQPHGTSAPWAQELDVWGAFMLECLAPYEMRHRSAAEARDLLRQMDRQREDDLRRIAREMHDSAGQLLMVVHLELENAMRTMGPAARPALATVRLRLDEVGAEIRRLTHELRPTVLDELGMVPAMRELVTWLEGRTDLQVTSVTRLDHRLPAELELALYRIMQEAVTNVLRHAHAHRLEIGVEAANERVHLWIVDDGVGLAGMAADTQSRHRGIGLASIAERVSRLKGQLRLESAQGKGTALHVHAPWRSDNAGQHPSR